MSHSITRIKNKQFIIALTIAVSMAGFTHSAETNLCRGLITDKKPRLLKSMSLPDVGKPYLDPVFGTKITRITNASKEAIIKPLYSTIQAWNADESLLILYHTGNRNIGHSLYNGKTYEYVKELDISPADLEQVYWHHSDPDILYYIDNYHNGNQKSLVKYNVKNDKKEAIHNFECDYKVSADSHAFISWDTQILGLICRNEENREIFYYDFKNKKESHRRTTTGYSAPLVSANGKLFFHHGDVLDKSLKKVRSLKVGNPYEHSSLGELPNGINTYNEVSFDGKYIGSLVTHDMTNSSVRIIIGKENGYPYPPTGTHISAVSRKLPGWVAISSVGHLKPRKTFDQEIYLANTDPTNLQVCRVAHHRSWGKEGPTGYWAEPHVSISPSGTRLLFASDWNGSNTVNTFVIELPAYLNNK